MSVNGVGFLLFVLISVILYYVIPKKYRFSVLLGCSAVFYLSNGVGAAVYMLTTVVFTYGAGLLLDRFGKKRFHCETAEEKKKAKNRLKKQKQAVLAAALVVNFLVLAILKYSGFFLASVNSIFGRTIVTAPSFLLPLGISFYIFQTAGYLIDVYRGKYGAERNFGKYALFAGYFPQLVQGPINRYNELKDTLFGGSDLDWENIRCGILRMMVGILKKAMIADVLAPFVSLVYSDFGNYPGILSFLAAFLYCIQLYCDFSGGVDLLCGVSRLFGVGMAENFNQPYFAVSLADFWRRWHISLGEWMKDYLFYPLAFSPALTKLTKWSRKFLPAEYTKRLTPCICTFVVFLAVGVWQGPGWANVAYGLWNGFWMSLGLLWVPFSQPFKDKLPSGKVFVTVWGVLRTNFLVIIGRYFSNAHNASLGNALSMLKHTVVSPDVTSCSFALLDELGLGVGVMLRLIPALCVLFCISLAKEKGVDLAQWFGNRRGSVQFVLLFAALLLIVMGVYGNDAYTPIAYVYENV
ncbi:MAG: MBOAT family protein [Ruminococcaceae bacterium]|nr:MBOAT family protein [Oscillospiraceae bacterium]